MPFATGKRSRWGASTALASSEEDDNPYDAEKVRHQIENARTRLTDSGVNVDEDTDKRNWFERLTNLPQKQNWFFDALELLGRPGQAVLNTIDKSNDIGAGNAAWRGLSGQDRVRGADLVEKAGVDNKYLKAILGTGLEIVTDPTTYIPGAVFARGARAAGAGAKALGRGVYEGAERFVPGFGRVSENFIRPGAERVKDGLGYAFNRDYKIGETLDGGTDDFLRDLTRDTENTRRFRQEESLRTVTDAAKAAGGLEAGTDVGRVMEAPLRQFEDVQMYEFPDGVRRTANRSDLTDEITANRQNLAKTGKDMRESRRQYDAATSELAGALEKTNRQIQRLHAQTERGVRQQLDEGMRKEIRDASQHMQQIDRQLESFPKAEAALLRAYKKQVRQAHSDSFGLLKRVREVAPMGVRPVEGFAVPEKLAGLMSTAGKPIDEVASELGYRYADELIQELRTLDGLPRKLGPNELEAAARKEMERTGALADLAKRRDELAGARDTLKTAMDGIVKQVPDVEGKTFASIESNPRWQELEGQRATLQKQLADLRGESKQVRDEKLGQIKAIEDEIGALKESAKNPVMQQREIPRPEREMSTDPGITAAASTLVRSNNELRQFARDNGIHIQELEGYMKHVLSRAEREARARGRVSRVDQGSFNTGNPNKKVLAQRELTGSAEDVNERLGRDFFEPNAFFSTAIGQKQLIDYVQAVQFRRKILSNPKFARQYEKGMEVGPNQVVIDSNNYKFIKDADDELEGLASEVGGQYVVTKPVKNALDRYQRLTTDEGTKAMLKAYDTVLSNWKKLALLSPLYHVRNLAGAMFNNYVGGMNTPNLIKYTSSAFKDVVDAAKGKESELFREYRGQGLGAESLSKIEFLKSSDPETQVERMVKRKTATGKDKAISKLNLTESSREVGDFMDQANRFALYKWMRDKGASPEKAAAKVREVQFDYTKTSPFERDVVTRVVPFYRWMRNNIPFQLKQLVSDPRKYANVNKLRTNAQAAMGLDEENIPDFMKENFALPVSSDGEGRGSYLGLNLPLGDLTKVGSPLKYLVDSVATPIKLPFELSLNRDFFRDKPIQKFEGQETQYDLPGSFLDFGVNPYLAYSLEQLGGQPARFASSTLKDDGSVDQATKFSDAALGISSPFKPYDANKDEYYNLLEELQKLQDYMKYVEQQTGRPVRTLAEIQQALQGSA